MGKCAQYHKNDVYLQNQTKEYEANDITNTKPFDLRQQYGSSQRALPIPFFRERAQSQLYS